MTKNKWFFTLGVVTSMFLLTFHLASAQRIVPKKFVVVLDAGHGGHDPGNLGNGYLEKNIALAIVLEAGRQLEENPNVEVIYTRKDDTFVDLFKRGEIANQANADLFVSVHCDSHTSDAYGAGTFVLGLHANEQNFEVAKKENSVIYLEDNYEEKYAEYDINSPESVIGLTVMQEEFLEQSIQLAKLMQDNFTKQLKRKDRKVKQAGFIVLHQTFMPSVLIETGFLTNKSEGGYLNSSKGQQEMSTAIANAILNYKNGAVMASNQTPVARKPVQEKIEEQIDDRKKDPKPQPEESITVVQPKEPVQAEQQQQPKQKASKSSIVFKVQLMASGKLIALRPENFRGLNQLSKEPINSLYRYMYGATESYETAKELKNQADAKGYTSSYIVAYKNGVRIALQEALK